MTQAHTEPRRPVDPIVRARDVKYVRFSAPDLDVMERFVRDFGLEVVHRDDAVLYSRGLEASPFLHVVHHGPAKFIGFAFELDRAEDLQALADAVPGCSSPHDIGGIEGELGGGRRVHFVDPVGGFVFEAVHGQQAEPMRPRRDRLAYNHGGRADREGTPQDVSNNREPNRADPGPPEIVRLGHCVMALPVGPHQQMMQFLSRTFGMVASDAIELELPADAPDSLPPPLAALAQCESSVMAQFMRMDRGDGYTDHHSVFVMPLMDPRAASEGRVQAQLSHVAFEVFSMDDVFRGHMSLREKQKEGARYALAWGVGRHVYGSQIYDYWHDPYGHVHEHMCDGDRINHDYGSNVLDARALGPNGGNQWGPTVAESGVSSLDGPQCAPYFQDLPEDVQATLLSRDLSGLRHIVDHL